MTDLHINALCDELLASFAEEEPAARSLLSLADYEEADFFEVQSSSPVDSAVDHALPISDNASSAEIEDRGSNAPEHKPKKSRSKRRKKEKENQKARGGNIIRNAARAAQSAASRKANQQTDASSTALFDLNVSSTGRRGLLRIPEELVNWKQLSADERQKLLAPLTLVPQESKRTYKVVASNGVVLLVRTYPDKRMAEESWNKGLSDAIQVLRNNVIGPSSTSVPKNRNAHGSLPLGFQHAYGNGGKMPCYPQVYRENEDAFKAFEATSHWNDMLISLKFLFREHGGNMAEHAESISQEWTRKTENMQEFPTVSAPFHYFFSAWVNCPQNGQGQVLCLPHKDFMNVAAFWCAVFCYGAFSLEDSVFLVVWELNLILEFSPGSWIFFPSALLTHFNVSAAVLASKIEILKTKRGERPTRSSESFRGSIAFFNPASFFSVHGTEYFTLTQAQEAGHPIQSSFEQLANIFPTVDIAQ